MLDSVRLSEKSASPFAAAGWHGQLYLAWTGSDLHINLASSPDGRAAGGKQRLAQRSYLKVTTSTGESTSTTLVALPPSLAAAGEQLWLAWTGGDTALNLLAAGQPAGAAPVTLKERSGDAPSLSVTDAGALVLAWTGTDRHINLLTADAGTGAPGPKTRLEQATSNHGPALCSHQGDLVLAWTGSDRHLNVLTGPGDPWRPAIRLDRATSGHRPALCSHQGDLVLAWTGSDRHVNVLTGAGDPYGEPVRLPEAKSSSAPVLASYQGSLIVGWAGTDGHLNIARLLQ